MTISGRYVPDSAETPFEEWRLLLPRGGAVRKAARELLNRLTYAGVWQDEGIGAEASAEQAARVVESMDLTESLLEIRMTARGGVPAGWVICNGAIYNKADYPDAWELLDDSYRISATQFVVPNFVNRAPHGTEPLNVFDPGETYGSSDVLLEPKHIPQHTHLIPGHTHGNLPHSHSVPVPASPGVAIPGELPVPVPVMVPGLTPTATTPATVELVGVADAPTGTWPAVAQARLVTQGPATAVTFIIRLRYA